MALTLNTNISSLVARNNLTSATLMIQKSMERLSTGYRINHAGDDVAGLNISEGLRTQIRGSNMALRNAQDGASMLQVAEGAFSTITENLQRIRELTVQAASSTNSVVERTAIAGEVFQRITDITEIAKAAKFNSVRLLDGFTSRFTIQIGPNGTDFLGVSAAFQKVTALALGLTASKATVAAAGYFLSEGAARAFITTVDNALTTMFTRRSTIGSYQARLDSVTNNLQVRVENLSASESRIRDVDVAIETANLTRSQVLQQSAASILAQANQMPTIALSLIRG
jgi:flagellin